MTNPNDIPTPRTDAECYECRQVHDMGGHSTASKKRDLSGDCVDADFARTLERENVILANGLGKLTKELASLQSAKDHMEYCRSLITISEDEVLAEGIEVLLKELAEVKEELLQLKLECGICICPINATDEACLSCLSQESDIFERLSEVKEENLRIEEINVDQVSQISLLEKQVLELREALRFAIDELQSLGSNNADNFLRQVLSSTAQDLDKKWVRREVLEKAVDNIAYHSQHADSCHSRIGMACDCGLIKAITFARKELNQ